MNNRQSLRFLVRVRNVAWIFLLGIIIPGLARAQYVVTTESAETGKLLMGRSGHTATLMQNGKVLVTGGDFRFQYIQPFSGTPVTYHGYTDKAEVYDPDKGKWTATASMATNRILHSACLLADGKVLVTGGIKGTEQLGAVGSKTWTFTDEAVTSTEVYNPSTGTWTTVTAPSTGRARHSLVSLANGKVLLVGGSQRFSILTQSKSSLLYDPVVNGWSATGSLGGDPVSPPVLLKDGTVFVITFAGSLRPEIYDPASGVWTVKATAVSQNLNPVVLGDGRVLCAGSSNSAIYNPTTDTWTSLSEGSAVLGTPTLVGSGAVVFVGDDVSPDTLVNPTFFPINGVEPTPFSRMSIFDPEDNSFKLVSTSTSSFVNPLKSIRWAHTSTLLPKQNKLLLVGGSLGKGIYYEGQSTLSPPQFFVDICELVPLPTLPVKPVLDAIPTGRTYHTANLLNDGTVLIAAGFDGANYLNSARIFSPASEKYSPTVTLVAARSGHASVSLGNGKVLVAGGLGAGNTVLNTAETYNSNGPSWVSAGNFIQARLFPELTVLDQGTVVISGGYSGFFSTPVASCQFYSIGTNNWQTPPINGFNMNSARVQHRVIRLKDGRLLATGGFNGSAYLNSNEIYHPVFNSWSLTGQLSAARGSHTASLLADGRVLVAGGVNGTNYLSSTEIFDPATSTWTPSGDMATPRADHAATVLADGRVLITGGSNASGHLNSVEIYDPATGWSTSSPLATARALHTATLLNNGRVLVAFGSNGGGVVASSEVYNVAPAPLSFTVTSDTQVGITASSYTTANRQLNLSLGYKPTLGAHIVVVNNTGTAPINGVFEDVAQGQSVTLIRDGAAYEFIANYFGGTGNDFVLEWANKRPVAWGGNNFGQLGDSSQTGRLAPTDVTVSSVLSGKDVLRMAAGGNHSIAVCADGTLAAWGNNQSGQLGNGNTTSFPYPVAVSQSGVLAGKFVIALAAGDNHTLALCSDGTLSAWGANDQGQLGNGSTTASSVPVLVQTSGVLAGKRVVSIAAGANHSLALCSDGTLAVWGDNGFSQLGNNVSIGTDSSTPVSINSFGVLSGKTVIAIAAGFAHNLALCSDGSLASWGYGLGGQLGNGQFVIASAPVAVDRTGVLFSKAINKISAGFYASLVYCADGTLASWGFNPDGELGNGTTTTSAVPVLVDRTVAGLAAKSTAAVSSGVSHSLVQNVDGTGAGWGFNGAGQLGDNSSTSRNKAVAVDLSAFASTDKILGTITGPSASHSLGFIAGAPTTLVKWTEQNFANSYVQADKTISGPNANPAKDGIPNAVKYALGLDPNKPYGQPWQTGQFTQGGGGANQPKYLGITFSVPEPYPAGATLKVEQTSSLTNPAWTVLATKTGNAPWAASNGGVVEVSTVSGGKTSVTVRSGNAIGTTGNTGFLRMSVDIATQ